MKCLSLTDVGYGTYLLKNVPNPLYLHTCMFSECKNLPNVIKMSLLPTLEQTSKLIKFSSAVSGHLDKGTGTYFTLLLVGNRYLLRE